MTGAYEIETERLLLRQWRDGDWYGLHRTYGDQEVMGWIGSAAVDVAAMAAAVGRMWMHWRLLGYGMFAVEDLKAKQLVGRIGLMYHPDCPLDGPKIEVGWTLQRSAWGRGYATEGARAASASVSRSSVCPTIFSMTRPDNAISHAVMERCGLTLRGEVDYHGWHQVHYAIDSAAWPPSGIERPPMKVRRVDGSG